MSVNIAIDGPAGAGKSTIAKLVAKQLGYTYVDTGAMYRALAYKTITANVDEGDEDKIADSIKDVALEIKYQDGEQQIILDGGNVTKYLREEATGKRASAIAKYAAVRNRLTQVQREIAATTDVVMDGRDIGTAVLPNANVKIYLTASSGVRAKRRFDELSAKGIEADIDVIEKDIIARDEADMSREIAPLKQAEDATLVDSSYMTIDEVAKRIIELVGEAKQV